MGQCTRISIHIISKGSNDTGAYADWENSIFHAAKHDVSLHFCLKYVSLISNC